MGDSSDTRTGGAEGGAPPSSRRFDRYQLGGSCGGAGEIDADMRFTGTYSSPLGLSVHGLVVGSIRSGGHVRIERGASVAADIEAADVSVAGRFQGRIRCRGRLEIEPGGVVTGAVETDVFHLAEGGFFDGQLDVADAAASVLRAPTPIRAAS